jgi:hypothetical protein
VEPLRDSQVRQEEEEVKYYWYIIKTMLKSHVVEFEKAHGRTVGVRRFVNFVLQGGTTPPKKRTRPSSTPQGTPQGASPCDTFESLHSNEYNEYKLQDNVWKLPANMANGFGMLDVASDFFIVKSIPSVDKPTKQKPSAFRPLSETMATNVFAMLFPHTGPAVYNRTKCTDGNTYLCLEFVAGQTFEAYMIQHGDLTEDMQEQVDTLIHQLAEKHLRHDDLNMENLIWDGATHKVRLIDFGKVSQFDDQDAIPRATEDMQNNFNSQYTSVLHKIPTTVPILSQKIK